MRLLRRLFVILCLVATGVLIWAGVYTRKQGFTKSWRAAIEREFTKRGYYVEIGKITLGAFRGLVAEDVRFFQDIERTQELAFVDDVFLDVDMSEIFNKKTLSIKTLDVENASLSLPIDPAKKNSPRIRVNDLSGRVEVTESVIEILRAEAKVAGIDVNVKGSLLRPPTLSEEEGAKDDESEEGQGLKSERKLIQGILHELAQYEFSGQRPVLEVEFRGDMRELATSNVLAKISAESFRRKSFPHEIAALSAEVEYDGQHNHVFLKNALIQDDKGTLSLDANWKEASDRIEFTANSNIDLMKLTGTLGIDMQQFGEFVLYTPPTVTAEGHMTMPELLEVIRKHREKQDGEKVPFTFPGEVLGEVHVEKFVSRGTVFSSLDFGYSLADDRAYLRNLRLEHKSGVAFLNLKHEPGKGAEALQYQSEIKLDPMAFQPFFGEKGRKFLSRWKFDDSSTVYLAAAGQGPGLDFKEWQSECAIDLRNFSLNGVPFLVAEANLKTDSANLYFRDVKMIREEGHITGEMAQFVLPTKQWKLKGVTCTADPVQTTRAFSAKAASVISKYQFTDIPTVRLSGNVDGRSSAEVGTSERNTDLKIAFASDGQASMQFLGKTMILDQPKGDLHLEKSRVHITSLTAGVFGGKLALEFDSKNVRSAEKPYDATIAIERIPLEKITLLYSGTDQSKGLLTGSFNLSGNAGSVNSLNGHGQAMITNGDLFGIPVFGPLSKVIKDASPNVDRNGYSIAREAKATLRIENGVIYSEDFQAFTDTFRLNASGLVNSNDKTIKVLAVMSPRDDLANALVSPFKELLAYEGTGEFSNPTWKPKALSEVAKLPGDLINEVVKVPAQVVNEAVKVPGQMVNEMSKIPGEMIKTSSQLVEDVAEVPVKGLQMIGKTLLGGKKTDQPSAPGEEDQDKPKKPILPLKKLFGGKKGQ